jgi:hypothetical protein
MLSETKFLHTIESILNRDTKEDLNLQTLQGKSWKYKYRHGYVFNMVGKIIPMRLEKIKIVDENLLGRPRTRPRDHANGVKNGIHNKRKSGYK